MNHQTRRISSVFLVPFVMLSVSTQAWGQVENETFKIRSVGSTAQEFGYSLAIDGGFVAVGAPRDTTDAESSGAVYLFDLEAGEQLMKFLANDGQRNNRLGDSVAMSDGLLAAGAPQINVIGGETGHVYLYNADPGSPNFGDQIAILSADDGANGDGFGTAVVMGNGVAAVGAPFDDDNGTSSGSVYFFDVDPLSPNFGDQIVKVLAENAASQDEFGFSLAIDTGLLVVGAWNKTAFSGAAYVFDADPLSPGFGDQLTQLVGEGVFGAAEFGRAVSIDDHIAAIGARRSGNGGVHLFDVDPMSPNFGSQTMKINVSFNDAPGFFGHSVAINAGTVAVGSPLGNANGFGAGVAFLFDAISGEKIAHYLPSDGASFGQFGFSAGIDDGGAVVIGAMGGIAADGLQGSAYVFDGPPFVCAADLTDDGELNFFDVSVFLTFFGLNDPIADFNADGEFNFFDVSAFLAAFAAGCP
jgi:FG-GAP repeat protein